MRKIQVLGPGCPNCEKLAHRVAEAAEALGLDCEIEKVTGLGDIAAMGVMLTPALAIDGEVVVSGRVPSVDEIKTRLERLGGAP